MHATMLYHQMKDTVHVMQVQGHKKMESTLLYTQLIEFSDHEYTCKVAVSVKEAKALVEAGFEYVTAFDGHRLFRKRK